MLYSQHVEECNSDLRGKVLELETIAEKGKRLQQRLEDARDANSKAVRGSYLSVSVDNVIRNL